MTREPTAFSIPGEKELKAFFGGFKLHGSSWAIWVRIK